ncbi:MAG: hypothetical protein Terrestrivirus3_190 [Terrestrivirus sp.]|uniref:Uncharacterized protein n=1 Tax=Terrestrivirus sp. TaxID=2487775 RepID=A0A3G4ZPM8_9VIRU|nr:MAG: hypothetical protein Terrestrivirus3_190 [Terrestrivirus sp.]
MGNYPSSGTQNLDKNQLTDSDSVRKNIMRVFREKNVGNHYTDVETLDWHSVQNMGNNQFGGNVRNRYEQFNPQVYIDQLIEQNKRTQSSMVNMKDSSLVGGNFGDQNEYHEINQNVLASLRKHIIEQTGGASCPCDGADQNIVSSTSAQEIDYSVLKGGAKTKKDDDDDNDDDFNDDDAEDNDDDDDDEDEDENNDEDEDEDEDDSVMERSRSKSKKSKKSRQNRHHGGDPEDDDENDDEDDPDIEMADEVDEMTGGSSDNISKIIKPFYSTDSDHYHITKRRSRFD